MDPAQPKTKSPVDEIEFSNAFTGLSISEDQVSTEKVGPIFSKVSGHSEYPTELHNITKIENLKFILSNGIQSKSRYNYLAKTGRFTRGELANDQIQDRRLEIYPSNPEREKKKKSNLSLTQYANLYITAHNAMLYNKCKEDDLCVLRIDPRVLENPEGLFSTRNAATNEAKFIPTLEKHRSKPRSISPASTEIIFHQYCLTWKSKSDKKRQQTRQAEVLIPHKIHPSYIRGVYVRTETVKQKILALFNQTCPIPIDVHPTLFPLKKEHKDFTKDRSDNVGANPIDPQFTPQEMKNTDFSKIATISPESDEENEKWVLEK